MRSSATARVMAGLWKSCSLGVNIRAVGLFRIELGSSLVRQPGSDHAFLGERGKFLA
jgi:hypothetical protein